jgi:hypothetical protein
VIFIYFTFGETKPRRRSSDPGLRQTKCPSRRLLPVVDRYLLVNCFSLKPPRGKPRGMRSLMRFNNMSPGAVSNTVGNPDPPAAEFAGGSRRWVRRRTKVRQAPFNKEDPVKSAAPKGQKVVSSLIVLRFFGGGFGCRCLSTGLDALIRHFPTESERIFKIDLTY